MYALNRLSSDDCMKSFSVHYSVDDDKCVIFCNIHIIVLGQICICTSIIYCV